MRSWEDLDCQPLTFMGKVGVAIFALPILLAYAQMIYGVAKWLTTLF
jgi:hypothetical protein